jgi:hypothetical protein
LGFGIFLFFFWGLGFFWGGVWAGFWGGGDVWVEGFFWNLFYSTKISIF